MRAYLGHVGDKRLKAAGVLPGSVPAPDATRIQGRAETTPLAGGGAPTGGGAKVDAAASGCCVIS